MGTTLDKKVLVLNKNWVAIRTRTVKDAIRLVSRDRGVFVNPDNYSLYTWEEWVMLEIAPGEKGIATTSRSIKIPEIVLLTVYGKIPISVPRLTKRNIFRRDRNTCQYTGKEVSAKTADIDHIIPVSRGGKNSWENMVVCDREINRKKADKTPSEAGLRLIKRPKRPTGTQLMIDSYTNIPESWRKFIR
jgi:5-methylcytosine-specific restriction endonuclease McrA